MASQTTQTIRSSLLTTIFGGRLGLTVDGYLGGMPDIKKQVIEISTTVPTTVGPDGYVRVLTSGSSQGPTQHNLAAPIKGVELTIMLNSTSTGSQQFLSTPNGASIFISSLGSTGSLVNLVGPSGSVTLVGMSSAIWSVKSEGLYTSTAFAKAVTFTTST